MEFKWENSFAIATRIENGAIVVSANAAGVRSLANRFLALADEGARGAHFHLDEFNSLEEDSTELIVEKVDS
ncbi:MAG: hypothetical protein IJ057_05335 [Bacteroidales bacterium]|nr:hypothetical protein [Bacteroidales bacterium]